MKVLITILGLFFMINLHGQDFNRISYQLNLGGVISHPYKKTIEFLPDFEGHPIMNYKSDYGYFFEFLLYFNFNSRLSLNSGVNFCHNKL